MGESDFRSEREAAAIGHILVRIYRERHRRLRWSLRTTIHNYCAAFDERSPNYYRDRTRKIRESTWVEPLHHPDYDPDWSRLRGFVARFHKQEVSDPCPRCIGWAGDIDKIKPTWTVVMGPPKYRNRFYVKAQ
jgi:hypothetical protein